MQCSPEGLMTCWRLQKKEQQIEFCSAEIISSEEERFKIFFHVLPLFRKLLYPTLCTSRKPNPDIQGTLQSIPKLPFNPIYQYPSCESTFQPKQHANCLSTSPPFHAQCQYLKFSSLSQVLKTKSNTTSVMEPSTVYPNRNVSFLV